jgi:predicted nucleic acid-binding Zn ribbon protein
MVTPLRDILKASAKAWGLEPAARFLVIRGAWSRIVGAGVAAISAPVALRGGRLYVGVLHPAAAQEVRLRRTQIARALNRELGEEVVADVLTVARHRLPGGEAGTGPRRTYRAARKTTGRKGR